ncbi:hypothetical protein HELRODRAFT_165154 [Helobdella robusta]|uniref:Uncharacterized protein n=1 Tax=Helobdella robusta TaxID=6412 RepID=T1EWC4_HELRO|nr:hypothetical protein HELRODRAFT_165154 [Helobdella robusta]ESN93000.1 hypothetical protein HELRODRAFT_165154 [Helobdella robusta]
MSCYTRILALYLAWPEFIGEKIQIDKMNFKVALICLALCYVAYAEKRQSWPDLKGLLIKRYFRDVQQRSSMNFENRWVLRSALNFASDGEVVREVASAREQDMEIYGKRKGHEQLDEQQS